MSLNWQQEWILPYESPWSIIEKIKFANQISSRQLLQTFGTDMAKKNKVGYISEIHRDLYELRGFNHVHLNSSLGFSLHEHNAEYVLKIMHPLPHYIKREELIRDNLTYCIQCLNRGYHSLLHQFSMIHHCPFHLSELEEVCVHCNEKMLYMITPHNIGAGFLCSCGESLISHIKGEGQFIESWSELLNIQDSEVIAWLNLSGNNEQRIKNSYLISPHLTNRQQALKHLIVTSNKDSKCIVYHEKHISKRDMSIYDQIYSHLRHVLLSFDSYVWRSILSEHRHCINRFLGLVKQKGAAFPHICPYAYAYVFWKESFYNKNTFYKDEILYKKINLKRFTLPFELHSEVINELIHIVINNVSKHDEEFQITDIFHWRDLSDNIDSLLWILGHVVWNLALDHFTEWIKLSDEYADKHIRPVTRFDKFQLRDSIFSFVRTDESIEYHVTREKIDFKGLTCPYKDNKSMILSNDEISHLPKYLALQPGFEEEIRQSEKYLAGLKIFAFI